MGTEVEEGTEMEEGMLRGDRGGGGDGGEGTEVEEGVRRDGVYEEAMKVHKWIN